MDFVFFINSILLGLGLAMDAFSVSLSNGLNEPTMKKGKMLGISGIFGVFQGAMPMVGWICVTTIAEKFSIFEKFIPWIALLLLIFIGGKMLIEGIKNNNSDEPKPPVKFGGIVVQGIATSIDALSVGFTISEYGTLMAFIEAMIIAAVTFAICYAGVIIGKHFGTKISGKSSVLGGGILIFIGAKIFFEGVILPLVK
jgi:putative Mn2+ efflux pump MntP